VCDGKRGGGYTAAASAATTTVDGVPRRSEVRARDRVRRALMMTMLLYTRRSSASRANELYNIITRRRDRLISSPTSASNNETTTTTGSLGPGKSTVGLNFLKTKPEKPPKMKYITNYFITIFYRLLSSSGCRILILL